MGFPAFSGMHLMHWIAVAALALQILLLLYVAVIDIATRLIHNEICLTLALLGIASQFAGPAHIILNRWSSRPSCFCCCCHLSARMDGRRRRQAPGRIGGWPPFDWRGSVVDHDRAGRRRSCARAPHDASPAHPRPAPAGSPLLLRVYAVERWRNLRRAPLPFGAAIACGGIWVLFSQGI